MRSGIQMLSFSYHANCACINCRLIRWIFCPNESGCLILCEKLEGRTNRGCWNSFYHNLPGPAHYLTPAFNHSKMRHHTKLWLLSINLHQHVIIDAKNRIDTMKFSEEAFALFLFSEKNASCHRECVGRLRWLVEVVITMSAKFRGKLLERRYQLTKHANSRPCISFNK